MRRLLIIASGLVAFGVCARPVAAELTYDEFICEYRTSVSLWNYARARAGCARECQRDARAGDIDVAECVPPNYGDIGCVNGAEGKAGGRFCKSCNPDMPECYGVENCETTADGQIATFAAEADELLASIYCDESGDPGGLTALEGKCEDMVTAAVFKAAASYAKCLAKCQAYAFKGVFDPSACTPGAITDPTDRTQQCIIKVETKYALAIDKRCSATYEGDAPECHAGRTGSDWVDMAEDSVNEHYSGQFCES